MPPAGEVAFGQLLLNTGVTRQQPIHRVIQIVFGGVHHAQFLGQCGRVPQPGGAQFRARVYQALGDHGEHELPFPTGFGRNNRVETELSDRPENGFYRTMREGALHNEKTLRRDERHILQEEAEGLDLCRRPMRQISQGPLVDGLAFPPALTQENRGTRLSIGNRFDIHGDSLAVFLAYDKLEMENYMGTIGKSLQKYG